MIRGYFSVSKCVKSLHGLRKTERATGVFSSLKNYSVSAKSEAESKSKNETEEEDQPGGKRILSAAFANLKDEDVNEGKDSVTKVEVPQKDVIKNPEVINVAQSVISKRQEDEFIEESLTAVDPKTVGTSGKGFKDDIEKLKALFSAYEKSGSDLSTEKLKKVVSTLQKKIGQPPSPKDETIIALQEKVTDYIRNVRSTKPQRQYGSIQEFGYLQKLEQEVKQGRQISVTEIIAALKNMVESRSRPEPFLRLLASKLMSQENLDIKECSDILYSLAALRYREEKLIAKITENVCLQLDSINNASVINCILRSYATLSYRDPTVITILVDWISKNREACRDQIISSAVMSLAILNFFPAEAKNLVEEFSNQLNLQNSPDTSTYLDNVWSLVLLNCATHDQVNEVLSTNFTEKLRSVDGNQIGFSKALKLLNINGYASNILKDYKGSILTNSLKDVIPSPKYKTNLIASVIDALLNLMPSSDYIVTNVNPRCGFVIDAEFFVDAKGKPLPYVLKGNRSGSKVAVLVLGYFDLCYGAAPAPTGAIALQQRILEATGYKVLMVPYTEFSPNKRLVEKVQFLEEKIKDLAAS